MDTDNTKAKKERKAKKDTKDLTVQRAKKGQMAGLGDYVQISQIVINPENRAPQIPEDTKKVPYTLWIKGYALKEAVIFEEIEISTITGRKLTGTLTDINPSFNHSFGKYVKELGQVRDQVKNLLGGDKHGR
jgi:hypothetical protein